MRQHKAEKPFSCNICGSKFKSKKSCNEHKVTHSIAEAFKCDICQMTFGHQYKLKRHLKNHSDERPFQCEQCGKSFKTNGSLQRHIQLMHIQGAKPKEYGCKICGKIFNHYMGLRHHTEKHIAGEDTENSKQPKEKKVKCELCDYHGVNEFWVKVHIFSFNRKKNEYLILIIFFYPI